MPLLDKMEQQFGSVIPIVGPSAGRIVECLCDLVSLSDQVAQPLCRHW
ncbi:MAG TPA: hypothetical protein VG708_14055 [Mycobacteriales bacterium]|nr:hypothetical protein [Mycobacteriales bacterium]